MTPQEYFEQYLISTLDELQIEKAKEPKEPNLVTKEELYTKIEKDKKVILNKLFHKKQIRVHKTIHAPIQDFIELVKPTC